ncbi:hypothetical protein O181_078309 [Austropuccinia psidii MF-1]|uniref:ubiquitinyl hydrolase 1 n=1 Tax=Austropuccinia psidii MF-1 TaxID=1389203 RepID=A0A9Q3FGP6_9BASI|nr:hypothetical protein [Austropuccinia psidii MF-1]
MIEFESEDFQNFQNFHQSIKSTKDSKNSEINQNLKTSFRFADHLSNAPGVSFSINLNLNSNLNLIRSKNLIQKFKSSKNSRNSKNSNLIKNQKFKILSSSTTTTTNFSTNFSTRSRSRSGSRSRSRSRSRSISSASSKSSSKSKPIKSWADLLKNSSSSKNSNLSITPTIPTSNSQSNSNLSILKQLEIKSLNSNHSNFLLIPCGLINNGNICFANAILQVLVHSPPFYNLLNHLDQILPLLLKSQNPLLMASLDFLKKFKSINPSQLSKSKIISNSNSSLNFTSNSNLPQSDPFIPLSIWSATKNYPKFNLMRSGQQQDAQEFLCLFLDTLDQEINSVINLHDSSLKSNHHHLFNNLTLNDWLEVGSKGKTTITRFVNSSASPLSNLFDLKTRSILHRPNQKDSITIEPTNILQLSIEHPSILTIEDALAHFSKPDLISDMKTKNGRNLTATKQVYLDSFPPILVLHLKRFNYNSLDCSVTKNHKQIKFKTHLQIPPSMTSPNSQIKNLNYTLFAALYHHGQNASGGHYTVSIKQISLNQWIYIDDTKISHIQPSQVINPSQHFNQTDHHLSHSHLNLSNHSLSNSNHHHHHQITPYLLFYLRDP